MPEKKPFDPRQLDLLVPDEIACELSQNSRVQLSQDSRQQHNAVCHIRAKSEKRRIPCFVDKDLLATSLPEPGSSSVCYGLQARSFEQVAALRVLQHPKDYPIVVLVGQPGAGKTSLALTTTLGNGDKAQAVFIVRPPAGEKVGTVPGEQPRKIMASYMAICRALQLHPAHNRDLRNKREYPLTESGWPSTIYESVLKKFHSLEFLSPYREDHEGRTIAGRALIIDDAQRFSLDDLIFYGERVLEGTQVIYTGTLPQKRGISSAFLRFIRALAAHEIRKTAIIYLPLTQKNRRSETAHILNTLQVH